MVFCKWCVAGACRNNYKPFVIMSRSLPNILDISSGDKVSIKDVVDQVVPILSSGGVVALPTDTVYGIGCSVDSDEGIRKLYDIKERNTSNPISICVSDLEDMHRLADVTISEAVLKKLFPGQVTAVFTRKEALNANLNPGTSLVGIRIPDHQFIRQLVGRCPFALALTSANKSGTQSTLEIKEFQELWPMLNAIVDGGRIHTQQHPECRKGSTVLDLSVKEYYRVLRQGSSCEEVLQTLRNNGLKEL